MINFNQWFYPVLALFSGILLMLLLPVWLNVVLLILLVTSILTHQAIHHLELFWQIIHFVTEFLGFCILVALFVGFTIGLYQVMA